ncbi:hypothetical protein M758_3G107200 [Ceratodon purpureus]|nr:hypothetical protein M758_3G107200 [Ceratodon purpureus]
MAGIAKAKNAYGGLIETTTDRALLPQSLRKNSPRSPPTSRLPLPRYRKFLNSKKEKDLNGNLGPGTKEPKSCKGHVPPRHHLMASSPPGMSLTNLTDTHIHTLSTKL